MPPFVTPGRLAIARRPRRSRRRSVSPCSHTRENICCNTFCSKIAMSVICLFTLFTYCIDVLRASRASAVARLMQITLFSLFLIADVAICLECRACADFMQRAIPCRAARCVTDDACAARQRRTDARPRVAAAGRAAGGTMPQMSAKMRHHANIIAAFFFFFFFFFHTILLYLCLPPCHHSPLTINACARDVIYAWHELYAMRSFHGLMFIARCQRAFFISTAPLFFTCWLLPRA